MEEKGKVIGVKGNIAVIEMERNEKCDKCGLCRKTLGRTPFIEVKNKINAEVGEEVIVKIDEKIFLKIISLIYGMPVLGLICGSFFSYFLTIPSLKVICILFFLLVFWYSGFKIAEKYGKDKRGEIISKN